MPVIIWEEHDGALRNQVETTRPDFFRGEGYRTEARELDQVIDQAIDHMLDRAVSLATLGEHPSATARDFVQRWSIGRALRESGLMESEHLDAEERKALWLAIARKCRIGVRADGSREDGWRRLIPKRTAEPERIERDIFAAGLWLQEQELDYAIKAFGASPANALRLLQRRSISVKNVRDALARWFTEMEPQRRATLTQPTNFKAIAKALAKRFPARGPGSAKRPVHYTDDALYTEMLAVLEPLAEELAPAPAPPSLLPSD